MSVRTRPLRLLLYFTRGVSLAEWDRLGMFDRETALYRALAAHGVRTTFLTHGGPEDLAYRDRLGDHGISILCDLRRLGRGRRERLLPLLAAPALLRCDLVKTNQANGGELAARDARLFRKSLIARCGYMWSEFVEREQGPDSPEARRAHAIEDLIFRAGARVVVTTPAMRDALAARLPEVAPRIRVVPNYVDTDAFSPDPGPRSQSNEGTRDATPSDRDRFEILFVGRIAPQKNLPALLAAFERLVAATSERTPERPLRLTIVGEGPDRDALRERFAPLGDRVAWLGAVPHADLPALMRRADVFCLPSLYEGHPKALIEAMACGMAVLAADAPGLREVVRDGATGLLRAPGGDALHDGLATLLRDAPLRARLGAAAREEAVANYSLDRIVERELSVYEEALHATRGPAA